MSAIMSTSHPALFKDIRTRLGLTQGEIAEKLAVTPRTVNRWETGRSEMPGSTLSVVLSLLRAKDAAGAEQLSVAAGMPSAVAQEEARRAALDHAIFVVADTLDIAPSRAREVLSTFLTHLAAAGMSTLDARTRLAEHLAREAAARAPVVAAAPTTAAPPTAAASRKRPR